MKNSKIEGVEILGLTIVLYGEVTDDEEVDLGAVTISRDNREYIVDVVQSNRVFEDGFTTIEAQLKEDVETFDECPYDITAEDLMSNDLEVTFYIGGDFSATIEHMTLYVRFGGENGMTKAIDVSQD